jgi:hypothetical protein
MTPFSVHLCMYQCMTNIESSRLSSNMYRMIPVLPGGVWHTVLHGA